VRPVPVGNVQVSTVPVLVLVAAVWPAEVGGSAAAATVASASAAPSPATITGVRLDQPVPERLITAPPLGAAAGSVPGTACKTALLVCLRTRLAQGRCGSG